MADRDYEQLVRTGRRLGRRQIRFLILMIAIGLLSIPAALIMARLNLGLPS